MKQPRTAAVAMAALFAGPSAFANDGFPMISVVMPSLAVAFIPMVVIEARLLGKRLFLEGRRAVKTSILANLASSALGIPLTWLVLVAVQMSTGGGEAKGVATVAQKLVAVTWQAPMLVRYGAEMGWMVPAAALVLLVPFFLVSWRIETAVARITLPEVPRAAISRVVLLANAVTYAALALVAAAVLISRAT